MSQQIAAPKILKLDVFSDVICPWCFIGKHRLDTALKAVDKKYEIHVQWRPFELNPGMPPEGMDRNTYLAAKFGSPEKLSTIENRLMLLGSTEGIAFAFDKIKRIPNTLNAHRLIWLAQRQGLQSAAVEALFQAYFVQANDIGFAHTLVEVASQIGLNPGSVQKFLYSYEAIAEIRREEEMAYEAEVYGVPHFVIQDKSLSGAQPVEALLTFFDQAAAQTD